MTSTTPTGPKEPHRFCSNHVVEIERFLRNSPELNLEKDERNAYRSPS